MRKDKNNVRIMMVCVNNDIVFYVNIPNKVFENRNSSFSSSKHVVFFIGIRRIYNPTKVL